ncbi:MAG: hypothetical protein U1A78_25120 [Polyangia bacterium]
MRGEALHLPLATDELGRLQVALADEDRLGRRGLPDRAVERVHDLRGGGRPLPRIEAEPLRHQLAQRDRRIELAGVDRLRQDGLDLRLHTLPLDVLQRVPAPGQDLEGDHAECVQSRRLARRPLLQDLGRQVDQRAGDRVRAPLARQRDGQAKVEHLGPRPRRRVGGQDVGTTQRDRATDRL